MTAALRKVAVSLLALAPAALSLISCGRVDRTPHYDDPKDYGRTPVAVETPADPVDSGVPGSTPASVRVSAPAPETVVASVMFKGSVDPESFRFITYGGTVLNPWDLPGAKYLKSYFEGEQSILFYGRQTYGDEATGVSLLIQDGISNSADMGVLVGGESESGTQVLERLVGNDEIKGSCPTAAVCIRSMLWKPVSGAVKTFCYKDWKTGEPVLMPYAPAPNFPAKDAQKAAGSYGPYRVETWDGQVNCLSPGSDQKPIESHNIIVRFKFNPAPAMKYTIKKKNKIAPDYSVRVTIDKMGRESPLNEQPYVDSFSRMQAESEYFISSQAKSLLKIIKRTRKSINFPGDDTWIGTLVRGYNTVSPVTGILMDVHAEYCVNLLDKKIDNECEGTVH